MVTLSSKVTPSGVATAAQGTLAGIAGFPSKNFWLFSPVITA